MSDYHKRHEPYLRAVAAALAAAAVCWQEERGWWLTIVPDTTSSDGRFTYELRVATIASPSTVVAAVASEAGLTIVPPDCEYPDVDFPDHVQEVDEDPAFEAALAVYAQDGAS